jgi:hypothetical protein
MSFLKKKKKSWQNQSYSIIKFCGVFKPLIIPLIAFQHCVPVWENLFTGLTLLSYILMRQHSAIFQ